MNFIRNALLLRDEATIGSVLRESNPSTRPLLSSQVQIEHYTRRELIAKP